MRIKLTLRLLKLRKTYVLLYNCNMRLVYYIISFSINIILFNFKINININIVIKIAKQIIYDTI
jgi:hypothetical protein